MNKHFIILLTSISSICLLSNINHTVIAKEKDHTVAITNSNNISNSNLNSNHSDIDDKTQDALVKHVTKNTEKPKSDTSDDKSKKDDKNEEQTSRNVASVAEPTDMADTETAHYQKGVPKMFKITFYDPKVLGASTMPGGLYAGVAADLNVFPKGTRLKITLPDGTVLKRVVNDTGTFAYTNHYQLDIAYPNSSIPSYGTTMAKVEVLS